MQFIDLKQQYSHLKLGIDRRVHAVLEHGKYIDGPEVSELEDRLSEYVGVRHVINCANGTDALQLALMALGVERGDAIFCPTFTFFSTAEVISLCGAQPVFVDVEENTFNISPDDLERRVSEIVSEGCFRPKAIISVDLFGLPANYPKIAEIAARHNLKIIEDAAQGFGGKIEGKRACSFGDIATTSFFPAKPLGCYGDGGALFTNDDELAEILRSLRVHGKGDDKYDNVRIGMNSRLDTIQAAVLLEKMDVFEREVEVRNKSAELYSRLLSKQFEVPLIPQGYESSWAQYTLKHEDRDKIAANLAALGVPCMIYYRTCMHQQTAFASLGYKPGDFPVAESLAGRVFSLPMHGYLEAAQVEEIANKLLSL